MNDKNKIKQEKVSRRKKRVLSQISGKSERLRFSVKRSLRHIYAQVIDDTKNITRVSVCDLSKEIREKKLKNKTDIAFAVGELVAEKCLAENISRVVFDRGSSRFHGRVKAVAEGARKKGLEF